MTWVYIPAVVLMVIYGLGWFIIGIEANSDYPVDGGTVIIILAVAFLSWVLYHALMEGVAA